MDEPRAALCDFINRQERGEIPETLIDFSSPQNVLVFDLGGGTLDVSFHQVRRSDGGNGSKKNYKQKLKIKQPKLSDYKN